MIYRPVTLRKTLNIRHLYSIHSYQFDAGYVFPGEQHDFWEMVYLDRGEADIGAGDRTRTLRQGDLLFHQPNEFHSIWANQSTGPNIIVISFDCRSHAMRFFRQRQFTLDPTQRRLLTLLISEARKCYGPLLDIHRPLIPNPTQPIGSEQLIGLYLEQLLLLLLREAPEPPRPTPLPPENQRAAEITQILSQHMRNHLDGTLRFEQLCRLSGLGATALKELFRKHHGLGVMAYYQNLRMEEARRMLRAGTQNISEIADLLGYPSIHAFSRQFKRISGMAPTEYQRMVQA